MKKKSLRARRTTDKGTASPTASAARKSRGSLVPRTSRQRALTEKHLGLPWDEWRQKKRQEWKAVMNALASFNFGSAYTPVCSDLYQLQRLANRMAQDMEGEWIAW